jgi:hypothetical protein
LVDLLAEALDARLAALSTSSATAPEETSTQSA